MDLQPPAPPLTDADVAALEATAPLEAHAAPPHGMKHALEACAARTRASIAEQPVRAALIAAAGGAALMMCAMRMLQPSHHEPVR